MRQPAWPTLWWRNGLAACATSIPAVQSIYHWQGQIESSTETLLLIKTGPDQLAALEARLISCIATRPRSSSSSTLNPPAILTWNGCKLAWSGLILRRTILSARNFAMKSDPAGAVGGYIDS